MPVRLSLSLISGPDAVRLETRAVDGYEFVLGRGHDVDWSLLDPEKNILSRRHCMLSLEDDDWWVIDLSGNGTFLNHEPRAIGEGGKRRLRDGDRMRVGAYEFQAQLADDAPVREVPMQDAPIRPVYRPDPEAEGWPPAPAGRSGAGANPFGDEDEEPPLAPRSAPHSPPRATATPNARAGNPFTDGADDGAWPPPAPLSQRPQASPFGATPADDPPVMRRAQASFNPFQDGSEAPAAPVAEPRPASPAPPRAAPAPPPSDPSPFDPPPSMQPPSQPAARVAAPAALQPAPEAPNPFAEPGDTAATTPPAPLAVVDLAVDPVDPPAIERTAPIVVVPPPVAAAPVPAAPGPAPPPVQLPPAQPSAAPVVAAAPAAPDETLLRALLQGAGLPDATPRDPEQAMRALGAAFRAMVGGLRDVQRARRTVRGGFRIAQTSWTENPLKVAVSDDDALEALLGAGRRSSMPPARAVEEVLKEIVMHEVATVAAMQEAVRTLLESLAPAKLRETAEQGGGLALLPAQRKARAWETYEATHARVTAALQDDFDSVFGRAFARAYERVVGDTEK